MAAFVEKMEILIIFVLCGSAVGSYQDEVALEHDIHFLSAQVSTDVDLACCFNTKGKALPSIWIKQFYDKNYTTQEMYVSKNQISSGSKPMCYNLTLKSVNISNSGLYRCKLDNNKNLLTHGTYLQVYAPLAKTINVSEETKNKILTAEGILLLLCVLLPSATLLLKSQRVKSLEKQKVKKEEENIYQGLNLDDCCSTYDQIERSQAQGPYQDVCNIIEEEEEIQLEKP